MTGRKAAVDMVGVGLAAGVRVGLGGGVGVGLDAGVDGVCTSALFSTGFSFGSALHANAAAIMKIKTKGVT